MVTKRLDEIARIDISGVDKVTKKGDRTVSLCNFTDVYYNWEVTSDDVPEFMVASANEKEITRFRLRKGYVAITKDSETRDDIGISCLITDDLPNTVLGYHCALVVPDETQIDPGYLNAYLKTTTARKHFSNQASGSGQRYTLTLEGMGAVKIPIIPLIEQKKISSFVANINRKIRVNKRINDNLYAQSNTRIWPFINNGKKSSRAFAI